MSSSILRSSVLAKHLSSPRTPPSARSGAKVRFASSGHSLYGPEYEAREGFRNPLFLWTGAGLVGLAIYHAYSPSTSPQILTDPSGTNDAAHSVVAKDQQMPWLTRFLARQFQTDPDRSKKVDAHNMAVVFDAADIAHFKASIDRPPIKRMANSGNFDIASPYGLVAGTQTDFSDLRIKSYRDDMIKPEEGLEKSAPDGDDTN